MGSASASEAIKRIRAESRKQTTEVQTAEQRKGVHQNKLLKLVQGLSWASFGLLAATVAVQMTLRAFIPNYTGISDIALNILAVSVFGEVIAIVGTIAYLLWKESKYPR